MNMNKGHFGYMRAGVSFVLHKLHKFVQSDEKDRAAFLDTEKTGTYNEVSSIQSRTSGGENSRLTVRQKDAQALEKPA